MCWALVAHACNPSYSEGRDQEDCGSKPAWTGSFQDPISKKKKITKTDWWSGVVQDVSLEFKPKYCNKKKKKKKEETKDLPQYTRGSCSQ
jgi:hypothetical protein